MEVKAIVDLKYLRHYRNEWKIIFMQLIVPFKKLYNKLRRCCSWASIMIQIHMKNIEINFASLLSSSKPTNPGDLWNHEAT